MKYKSCKDIETSLYIAPNEIRSCCQRYFYGGKMRGDAKLLEIDDSGLSPSYEDIKNSRYTLFEKIQNNQSESCLGCPFLYETENKPLFDGKINHLSVEHHSVCNLRCTYCSPIYYGGKRSKYNVVEFIKSLSDAGSFQECKQVVWGGGEPTLDKSFEIIVEAINKSANPKLYHRVFTNSVRYHEAITKFLKQNLIKIVTSIDAGSSAKFKEIRGKDKFFDVFYNLKKYSDINSNNVTIKYILTNDNIDKEELLGFASMCKKFKLENCCYQISMNYKYEDLNINFLKSIIFLMGAMKKNNIYKFFCDDHIAHRFRKLSLSQKEEINIFLKKNNLENILITNRQIEHINIFGAGDITKNILDKSILIKKIKNIYIFDSDKSKIGTKINEITILDPKQILENNYPIYISSAQSYDDIFTSIINLNIDTKRIISGLIV